MRIGNGYDVHRLVEGRKLILGGVTLDYPLGLLGHSDADVLTHAVCDALLGAAALGDIGKHFPDTDPRYAGADSLKLLGAVCELLRQNGYEVDNIDSIIVAQQPKMAPHIAQMRQNLADACGIDVTRISVKATTEEGLGLTGDEKAISSYAVALLR
ncbi:MAG: 2-C-methyl-D-erythritol 2,4-cyclodiphosphate synthase [Clostridia bacterium]|nr:2-C-methyl-D-erythritol 2,4-cyclodiphosphate synthase [Clostridia bacterium]